MENNFENTPQNNGFNNPMPPKPDNQLVMAIITTICCCLPFGIVSIVKAAKVNSLYAAGAYAEAAAAAADAKKWWTIGLIVGLVINIIYFIFYFVVGIAAING